MTESLRRSGIFQSIDDQDSDYTLLVSLHKAVDGGYLLGVTVTASWLLYRPEERSVLFQAEVTNEFGDAVAAHVVPGAYAVRNNNFEVAVKQNIEAGIRLLAEVDIPGLDRLERTSEARSAAPSLRQTASKSN